MNTRCLVSYICLFVLLSSPTVAQPQMVDPFFGISYDPSRVHFEQIPATVKTQCSEIRDRYAKAWVYGHLQTPDIDYFILYGYLKIPSSSHPGRFSVALEDGDGIIVAVDHTKCTLDQWQYFFRKKVNSAKNATPVSAPDEVLRNLALNIISTYAKAFGGKRLFVKKVTEEARRELPPVVREQLELFEKSSEPGTALDPDRPK